MFLIWCDKCGEELQRPGGLVFGPPKDDIVVKRHLCTQCYRLVIEFIGPGVWQSAT